VTDEDVMEKLTDLFRDILDDDDLTLTPQTTAADVSGWDSANHINIVVATEVRFKIRFTNGEIERLKNVGDFVQLIQHKLSMVA
jgi:acyl carrier protein